MRKLKKQQKGTKKSSENCIKQPAVPTYPNCHIGMQTATQVPISCDLGLQVHFRYLLVILLSNFLHLFMISSEYIFLPNSSFTPFRYYDIFSLTFWQYDDNKAQERLERKIQKAPAGQGTVRMLTREEWEEIQEIRPRTPFESKLARPNARIRTGEPLHLVSFVLVDY